MTIDDIEQMPVEERARRLVGDMPWVTENLNCRFDAGDLRSMITTAMEAAVVQERHRCSQIAFMESRDTDPFCCRYLGEIIQHKIDSGENP